MIRSITVPPLERLEAFLPKPARHDPVTRDQVMAVLDLVAAKGDQGVRDCQRKFDGVDLSPDQWEVPASEWSEALDRLDPVLREALETAVSRVREYHQRQKDPGFQLLHEDGSILGMRVTPIDRVGIYVPGGKASYPSSVIMNAVPASVAGVPEIILVTPPSGITDAVLAAAAISGVTRMFKIGGAQAIAALAYGTTTIPRVDKIVGPGNRWVAEAKRQVAGLVGIDMIAGPTEVLVIADGTADIAHVAADLIAQAEHDEDACAWCVTTDLQLAE
ncbi:MAG: histidinol dehydrogenase, partial [Gemmatimonadota bacterium]